MGPLERSSSHVKDLAGQFQKKVDEVSYAALYYPIVEWNKITACVGKLVSATSSCYCSQHLKNQESLVVTKKGKEAEDNDKSPFITPVNTKAAGKRFVVNYN